MKKTPNSPITGNFSQKDVNDGKINKQKQKAAVEGGVKDDLEWASHFLVYQNAGRKSLLMGHTL